MGGAADGERARLLARYILAASSDDGAHGRRRAERQRPAVEISVVLLPESLRTPAR